MPLRFNISTHLAVGILLATCAVPPSHAEPAADDHVAKSYRRGAFNAGLTLSAGMDTATPDHPGHDLAMAIVHCGWIVTDPIATNSWLKGDIELLAEGFGGAQFNPQTRYLFGLTLVARYNFLFDKHWVPFIEAGAGPAYTDIGLPDLSTRFQFNDQLGAGFHWFFNDKRALTAGYRIVHISNGGIKEPNHGFNNHLFRVGLTRFF